MGSCQDHVTLTFLGVKCQNSSKMVKATNFLLDLHVPRDCLYMALNFKRERGGHGHITES